jgi:FlaA1/EpsC-like NDP-sugar epimerase
MEHGGETFVLNMGQPVRILDLAEDLIRLSGLEPHRDIEIIYSGIRPGDKLTEELWEEGTPLARTLHPDIFRIENDATIPDPDSSVKLRTSLPQAIDELSRLSDSGDGEAIIDLLDGLIPGSTLRERPQPDITSIV